MVLPIINLTVNISPMVEYSVQTGSIPDVPHPDGVVPAARDEQVGDLRVPQEASNGGRVALQNHVAGLFGVVPDADGAVDGRERRVRVWVISSSSIVSSLVTSQ